MSLPRSSHPTVVTLCLAALLSAAVGLAGCSASPSASNSVEPGQKASSTTAPIPTLTPMPAPTTSTVTSGAAEAGAAIFTQGKTPTGQVQFTGGGQLVGNGACANCHGADAQGAFGPMISYAVLYGQPATGQAPRFTFTSDSQILAAINQGVAPGGQQLRPAMPRYALTPEQFADVLAYLKTK